MILLVTIVLMLIYVAAINATMFYVERRHDSA